MIATAMRDGVAAPALAELELAYAPPFNTAKDPVNLAGMIAGNVLDGTSRILHADAVPAGMFLLDVREVAEFENGTISTKAVRSRCSAGSDSAVMWRNGFCGSTVLTHTTSPAAT